MLIHEDDIYAINGNGYLDMDAILEWNLPAAEVELAALRLIARANSLENQSKQLRGNANISQSAFLHMQANIWRAAACVANSNTVVRYYKN
jgi:hypothetical protein